MSTSRPVVPVLMCGGSGSRLWPLSRAAVPKQFVPLDGPEPLLRATIARVAPLAGEAWIAVSNVEHRFLVAEQLRAEGIEDASVLLEPVARNTAPAIAVAALAAIERVGAGPDGGADPGTDPILLVLPSDHVVRDRAALGDALAVAAEAGAAGALVTFGVVPTGPETGYGYIRAGRGSTGHDREAPALTARGTRPVAEFVEKPDPDTAARYVASGDYFWNSGMFVFGARRYLEELGRHRPAMLERCGEAFARRRVRGDFTYLDEDPFRAIEAESVDYAVMEHTDGARVVPLDAGWSDVGSWEALWELAERAAAGNATVGDVRTVDTHRSYLRAGAARLVATVGVRDLVVVDTPDALLVTTRAASQEVKTLAERLREEGREEAELPARVLRPWGDYESLDVGAKYQVKRITVKPGAKLSIQKHRHRAEHWTVVEGIARVLRDEETYDLRENESTFLPLGCVHRLENPGAEPLILIEVQYGDYLGEDDIIRFADDYGRVEG